jgi:hypothetical protein
MTIDTVRFDSACLLEPIEAGNWRLHCPLTFTVYFQSGASEQITVPEGFITDLASVPRLPGMFLLFGNKARKSAVLHDWLYSTGERPREFADAVFYAAMRHEEPAWRRALMWLAVRLAGWIFYFTKDRTE